MASPTARPLHNPRLPSPATPPSSEPEPGGLARRPRFRHRFRHPGSRAFLSWDEWGRVRIAMPPATLTETIAAVAAAAASPPPDSP